MEVPVLLLTASPPTGGSRTTVPLWESGPWVLQPEAIRVLASVPFYWTFTRIKPSHLRIPHTVLYASCPRLATGRTYSPRWYLFRSSLSVQTQGEQRTCLTHHRPLPPGPASAGPSLRGQEMGPHAQPWRSSGQHRGVTGSPLPT